MVANSFARSRVQTVAQIDHLAGIDIERRTMHRLQHLVGHRGGSGDGQKFPARANGHFGCSLSGCRGHAWHGAARNSKGSASGCMLCRYCNESLVALFPDAYSAICMPDLILDLGGQRARNDARRAHHSCGRPRPAAGSRLRRRCNRGRRRRCGRPWWGRCPSPDIWRSPCRRLRDRRPAARVRRSMSASM